MDEDSYSPSAPDSQGRPTKAIGTIPALIGVYVLVQVFALVVTRGGDPYSMLLLQIPCAMFGIACFVLGRLSRGQPKTNSPRGRRWSFGLWALFAVVTVVACWLGYQLNWIRQRHAFIDEAKKTESTESESMIVMLASDPIFRKDGVTFPQEPPFPLRIFREEAVVGFAVVKDIGPERMAQAKRLFPEAHFAKMWSEEEAP